MRRRRSLASSLLACLAALGGLAPCAPSSRAATADGAALYAQLAEAARKAMGDASTPGLAVVVVDDQTTLWSGHHGVTAEGGAPVGPDTVFRVGSVAKPVTAAAVMRLVERGQLKLDEPVETALANFRPRTPFGGGRPVTIRALLAHHSGLPGDSLRGMWDKTPATICEAMPAVSGEWLVDAPQSQYRYSNLDFTALGCLIETASRQPFADAIHEVLLAPLGMASSTYRDPALPRSRLALPHRNGKPAPRTGLRDAPAGALSATAGDMGRFLRMLLAHGQIDGAAVLKPATVASLFKRQFDDGGSNDVQITGLGWMLNGQPVPGAGDAVWHSGQYPGYFSHVALLPAQRLGVVVLANDDAARDFAPKLAIKALELARQAKTGAAAPHPAEPSAPPHMRLDKAVLERYAGRYAVFDDIVRVGRDGDALALNFQGQGIELTPIAQNRFIPQAKLLFGLMKWRLDGVAVRMTARGGRQFAVVDGMAAPLVFAKLDGGAVPDAWRRRLGAWRVTNPDGWLRVESVRLDLDDGLLVLRVTSSSPLWGVDHGQSSRALRPINDALAITISESFGGGAVEATTRNGREALVYSGYILERAGDTGR